MTNVKGMPKSECPRIPPCACSVVPNLGNRAAQQVSLGTLKRELQPVVRRSPLEFNLQVAWDTALRKINCIAEFGYSDFFRHLSFVIRFSTGSPHDRFDPRHEKKVTPRPQNQDHRSHGETPEERTRLFAH